MSDFRKTRPAGAADLAKTAVQNPGQDFTKTVANDSLRGTVAFSGGDLGGTRVLYPEDRAPDSGFQALRTPGAMAPVAGAELPPDAPEWMRMGRLLTLRVEEAIRNGPSDLDAYAAVGRAWAAFALGGYTPQQLRQVTDLVTRAHKVLRETRREDRDVVIQDCSTLIKNGLPPDIRKWMPEDQLQSAVARLAAQEDVNVARVEAVASLLGWTEAARAWAAEAIAIATGELK